jgi:hypothetical protein
MIQVAAKVGITTNDHRLTVGKLRQARRELIRGRHSGAVDQYRNYDNVASQQRLDLDAHEVVGIGDARHAAGVGLGEPLGTDNHQPATALIERATQVRAKVGARGNIVDILEDVSCAEQGFQAIVDASTDVAAVFPAVRQE